MVKNTKPLGHRNYGSIAHLPNSRMGAGDHHCDPGQARIATEKARDRHDRIVVQEKLDGSNVGVARIDDRIFALTRAGYTADTSPYRQHWEFGRWVEANQSRFLKVLENGERLAGEWLMQAHGTRYALRHEPFVAFDLMRGVKRTVHDEFLERIAAGDFVSPAVVHAGAPVSVAEVLRKLGKFGRHGALDAVEGAVWRVERHELIDRGRGGARRWIVDFLVKYVRPDKTDGAYLTEVSGAEEVWNRSPEQSVDSP